DYGAIRSAMERFLADSGARCALLVDRAGQLVATVGEPPRFDATAFATLTAADFSANDQLAQLLGETEFSSLVHRGDQESMFLADIARRIILVVLFDARTTEGLVRLKARGVTEELTTRFRALFERGAAEPSSPTGILAGAEDEIDQLFR
ncbi:MAG TPA: roadblock/LC7 domain-containing protein, partial [Gemmatimonadaceae bacterium]|nr:roadblock/LC7 domain-containing protein [Gemmatimonadaceae bacterium]